MRENNLLVVKSSQTNVHTFVFDAEGTQEEKKPKRYVQLLLSFLASLTCIPFGIMLGWPSPTYVILLREDSPVPISMLLSPLIAGFLMFGTIFSTPFSVSRWTTSKNGMLIGLIIMTVGWTLMWQSTNVFYLLGSRLIIGLGFGYAVGQIRIYIKENCDETLSPVLCRMTTNYIILGACIAYLMGLWTNFRSFSMVAIIINIIIFFICLCLPPKLSKINKLVPGDDLSLIVLFKTKTLRKQYWTIITMAFIQQFTGAPAFVVYCQFLFEHLNIPHANYLAIIYIFAFFISNLLGSLYISNFNKKIALLFSCITVLMALVGNIIFLHLGLQENCGYTFFVLLIIYVIAHTLGLATSPFRLSDHLFPKNARAAAFNLYFMCYCLFAVLITKLFEVFYSHLSVLLMFTFCSVIGIVGCVFICICIPTKSPVGN